MKLLGGTSRNRLDCPHSRVLPPLVLRRNRARAVKKLSSEPHSVSSLPNQYGGLTWGNTAISTLLTIDICDSSTVTFIQQRQQVLVDLNLIDPINNVHRYPIAFH